MALGKNKTCIAVHVSDRPFFSFLSTKLDTLLSSQGVLYDLVLYWVAQTECFLCCRAGLKVCVLVDTRELGGWPIRRALQDVFLEISEGPPRPLRQQSGFHKFDRVVSGSYKSQFSHLEMLRLLHNTIRG